jgi:general secretion pathway protein F
MAGYEYQALDAQGRTVKGVIEGDTERSVRALLRERGLSPLQVEPIHTRDTEERGVTRRPFTLRRRLSSSELALLTRQFATLVRAGLTLEECLNVLIEQSESAKTRTVVAGVRGRVLEGQSLARGMATFPDAFPEIFRSMVDAGEQSGKLAEVLERLADYAENREALRQKVMLAFIYPVLVSVVAVVVISLLMIKVVPEVTRVFTSTGQTLPFVTRALILSSDILRVTAPFWLGGILAGLIGFRVALRNQATRSRWHALLLRLPVIGRLTRGVNAARFSDTLGILTASGVPLLSALQSAVAVVNNLPMRAAVEDTARQVREGGSLSRALGKTKLFPPLVVHLIASGESTGQLDQMLIRAAETQSRELEGWVRTFTALLEPLLILLMGLAVLFIVVAILLPIFEMNQLIK